MSVEQVLLVGITIGVILVVVVLLRGRSQSEVQHPLRTGPPVADLTRPDDPVATPEEAVKRLTETAGALRKLADLKDEEIQRDETERSAQRTGWRPIAASGATPMRRATDATIGRRRTPPRRSDEALITEVSQITLDPSMKMEASSAEHLRLRVGQAFSPAAPVARRDLFAGRTKQLESLVDVAFEKGQHAVIYGERGVGKTSLATVLALIFEDDEHKLAVRVNCDASDDFSSLWHKILDELELVLQEDGRAIITVNKLRDKPDLSPNDVRRLLQHVSVERECIVLIDEFDTMTDEFVPRLFADTIKTLSDQAVPGTLIVIGVADSLDGLLTEHGSISRALVSIHMPRMSAEELKDIVRRALHVLTMDIEPEALDLITHVAQGFPHFTHLLGQAGARAAIDERRPLITTADVMTAIERVSHRVEAWIQESYLLATQTSHDALYAQVLVAAALAPADPQGFFAAADVREPLSAIMGKRYDIPSFSRQLNALAESDRGPVLTKTGSERKYRYRFLEPHMEPYVLMKSLTTGLISRQILADFMGTSESPGNGDQPKAAKAPVAGTDKAAPRRAKTSTGGTTSARTSASKT